MERSPAQPAAEVPSCPNCGHDLDLPPPVSERVCVVSALARVAKLKFSRDATEKPSTVEISDATWNGMNKTQRQIVQSFGKANPRPKKAIRVVSQKILTEKPPR